MARKAGFNQEQRLILSSKAQVLETKFNSLLSALSMVIQAIQDLERTISIPQTNSEHNDEFLRQLNTQVTLLLNCGQKLGEYIYVISCKNNNESASNDSGKSSQEAGNLIPSPTGTEIKMGSTASKDQLPNGGSEPIITNSNHLQHSNSKSSKVKQRTPDPFPEYRMNRAISTIREMVQEWYEGIDGGPSVKSLEVKYGSKWRTKNDAERVYLGRRKVIIQRLEELEKQERGHKTREMIVDEMEEERKTLGKSIDGLGRYYRSLTSAARKEKANVL